MTDPREIIAMMDRLAQVIGEEFPSLPPDSVHFGLTALAATHIELFTKAADALKRRG